MRTPRNWHIEDHSLYPKVDIARVDEAGEQGFVTIPVGIPIVPFTPERCRGLGGAPIRASILPDAAAERKKYPVASGVLDYFPDAIAAIANLSYVGNEQHNPGKPLHWDRTKSKDEADTMMRHFLQRGTLDKDGVRHSVKMAWRALAVLQKEIEGEK
jgi:hypothetical protein